MYRAISAIIRWRGIRCRRSVSSRPYVSSFLQCLCLLVAASAPLSAQTPVPRAVQSGAARPDLRAGAPSEEALQKFLTAQQGLRAKQQRDARSATARAAIGGVTVAARCVEGFVVNGSQRASAQDVRIVATERRDCDAGRCRAYQVTAARDSKEPFDLEVSVTCS